MGKRFTISVLLIAAAIFAFLTYSSLSPIDAGASTPDNVSLGILSAQRVPGLLADVSSDVAIRSAVSANQSPGQECIAIMRDGRSIDTVNADQPVIPASTMKLLTATAALDLYGSDGKFTTKVKAVDLNNGVVNGPLYLVGGGDPLLFTSQYAAALNYVPDAHTSLEKLADQVAAKGVKVIHGSVIGDDSRFDQVRYLSTWDPGYQAQGEIGPTGGLQVNQGFEHFTGGRVPAESPTLQAAAVFTDLLKQRGIKIDSEPASGLTPGKAVDVTSIDSAPVSAIVDEMLTNSDNSTAEMMLRNVGVKASNAGTYAAGIAGVERAATNDGIDIQGLDMVDGSGLDRSNRMTCQTLVDALDHDGPQGAIAKGLPKAGQSGTLVDRMMNSPAVGKVAAKTGTLANVSALAGWVTPQSGSPISFAIVNNGIKEDQARGFEDALAISLASLPAAGSAIAYAAVDNGK